MQKRFSIVLPHHLERMVKACIFTMHDPGCTFPPAPKVLVADSKKSSLL